MSTVELIHTIVTAHRTYCESEKLAPTHRILWSIVFLISHDPEARELLDIRASPVVRDISKYYIACIDFLLESTELERRKWIMDLRDKCDKSISFFFEDFFPVTRSRTFLGRSLYETYGTTKSEKCIERGSYPEREIRALYSYE